MAESFWTADWFPKRVKSATKYIENQCYFAVRRWLHTQIEEEAKQIEKFIEECFVPTNDGHRFLRNHRSEEVLNRHPKTSHDQKTTAVVFGKLRGKNYHKLIHELITFEKFWWRYKGDAVHPRDIWFYTYAVEGGKWRLYLLSLLMRFTFLRTRRKYKKFISKTIYREVWELHDEVKTSEAYMWGLRCEIIEEKWFRDLYEKLCKKNKYFGSSFGLECFYFYNDSNQPVLEAALEKYARSKDEQSTGR